MRWVLVVALLLSGCKPWVVRPIGETQEQKVRLDAPALVDSIWSTKVLPAAAASADARLVLEALRGNPEEAARRFGHRDGTGPAYYLTKGQGRVLHIDEMSSVRSILIDLEPCDGRPDVSLEIGPVIRGTALRDSLPFIQFGQFQNQLEFARVGNELNARVLKTVLGAVTARQLRSASVEFAGAFQEPVAGAMPEIVPVMFAVRGGAR